MRIASLPVAFPELLEDIQRALIDVKGWLSPREIRLLALAAAVPTAVGRILEIGCFHGKSTIVLAKASQRSTQPGLVSVDPISPQPLMANLRRAGVERLVEFHQAYSQEFLTSWNDPIRMLWHDGSNIQEQVKRDVEIIRPFLVDKSVVMFHDVLNTSGERIRVYLEDILESDHFGPVGLWGSIGWSIFRKDPMDAEPFRADRRRLANKLRRLLPFHSMPVLPLTHLKKAHYRFMRWFVPHHEVPAESWLRRVA